MTENKKKSCGLIYIFISLQYIMGQNNQGYAYWENLYDQKNDFIINKLNKLRDKYDIKIDKYQGGYIKLDKIDNQKYNNRYSVVNNKGIFFYNKHSEMQIKSFLYDAGILFNEHNLKCHTEFRF